MKTTTLAEHRHTHWQGRMMVLPILLPNIKIKALQHPWYSTGTLSQISKSGTSLLLRIKAADFKANSVLAGRPPRQGRQGFPATSVQVFSDDGQDGAKITEGPSTTKTSGSSSLPPPSPSPPFPILKQLFPTLPTNLDASAQAPAFPARSDESSHPTTPKT